MLGFPEARLTLASDRPARACVAVRVCDVSPEGVSLLVTRRFLNLTHSNSHEHAEPLKPGRAYEVAFPAQRPQGTPFGRPALRPVSLLPHVLAVSCGPRPEPVRL